MQTGSIRHTVSFDLAHPPGSAAESDFLAAARALSEIDGVESFELLRQVGTKSEFRFGISMEFADRRAYERYDGDPAHVAFVATRWVPEVTAFLELDYTAL